MFPRRRFTGKQNLLFPLRPVIKLLLVQVIWAMSRGFFCVLVKTALNINYLCCNSKNCSWNTEMKISSDSFKKEQTAISFKRILQDTQEKLEKKMANYFKLQCIFTLFIHWFMSTGRVFFYKTEVLFLGLHCKVQLKISRVE